MSTLYFSSYFSQFNNMLERIEQTKTVHISLLKGVTVPDVLCLSPQTTQLRVQYGI